MSMPDSRVSSFMNRAMAQGLLGLFSGLLLEDPTKYYEGISLSSITFPNNVILFSHLGTFLCYFSIQDSAKSSALYLGASAKCLVSRLKIDKYTLHYSNK